MHLKFEKNKIANLLKMYLKEAKVTIFGKYRPDGSG